MLLSIRRFVKANRSLYIFLRGLRAQLRMAKAGVRYYQRGSYLSSGCFCGPRVLLREWAYVGPGCQLGDRVVVGEYSMLANEVMIVGADHSFDKVGVPIIFSGREFRSVTRIGRDAWVGARVIIMAGVKIGDGAVVAAGSVVTKDLSAGGVYGGVPARFIRNRFSDEALFSQHMEMLDNKVFNESLARDR